MKMSLLLSLCILLGATAENNMYDDISIVGCSDTDGEDMYGLDGEVISYADFIKKKMMEPQPEFMDRITYPGAYDQAVADQAICRQYLADDLKVYKNLPLELDAPHSSIYTRDAVEVGVENFLICHVTGFYPAPVTVTWTKNNVNVTEGSATSVPFVNKDGTFNQFSRLKFTPGDGDIYSCTVKHRSLSEPLTRIWDVEQNQPSIGPAVFCGLGLTVGLMGVAAGTFFLIKGNECN